MKNTLINFYTSFYGIEFARHFRRPPDFHNTKFRTQFTVTNPKQLYIHVSKNSGFHPCFVSTHDYGSVDNLKHNKSDNVVFDRVYFDFDVDHLEARSIKYILKHLKSKNFTRTKDIQNKLKTKLRFLIIEKKIAKPAIDEAKSFAKLFKKDFGKEPALFFSGFKGCHAYIFFEPTELINPNRTVEHFAEKIKEQYHFDTIDLAVNKDAIGRLSRIPYSKHQYTDLTVVPFDLTDSYNKIMENSLNPIIDSFDIENHYTRLDLHLKKIDKILEYNYQTDLEKKKELVKIHPLNRSFNNLDHRSFFKDILGEAEKEYPDKEYVMYCCPFPDHEDNSPSFRVHKTGYLCYGCQRKGNYWEFLKEYNKWTDEDVKKSLVQG
jgi:hypothetical protein